MDTGDCIQNIKNKIKIEEAKKERLFKKLNEQARNTARLLGEKYKLEKVFLFGSIVNKDKFSLNSDVDFAVKVLKSEKFLEAWGFVEERLNHKFDLVRMEKSNKSLISIIKNEGEVIYESGRKKSQ